jgi:endonuclease/exonuclease/phosphatase family metal-dependent hydrolase
MRIATFNIENLFSRPRVMNLEEWKDGKQILTEYSQLNNLIQEPIYTEDIKSSILTSLKKLDLEKTDESDYVILRKNRGQFLKRPKSGSPVVIANGRNDWIGWLDLTTQAINEVATKMTAQVIKDVNADILAVIEAEDRIALTRFNDQLLKPIGAEYNEIMLIDGNDERGIDVGLLTKSDISITSVTSHINDKQGKAKIFSRDCPEYTVRLDKSTKLLILVNHFKSKGYGIPAESNAKRKAQAQRVREIYDQRIKDGIKLIAVVGDFNDTPISDPLSPLLGAGSDLQDISLHPKFKSDGREGTFGNGAKSNKIDYLLLSPDLFAKVTDAGPFRKGVWGGKNGTLFPHYAEMTKSLHAASDHAALWADIDV